MKKTTTILAAIAASLITTTASAELRQVPVGGQMIIMDTANLCARHNETVDGGHQIKVYASGQVIVGRLFGAKYNFGFICADTRRVVNHSAGNSGESLAASQARSGETVAGETQTQDEGDGRDDGGNNTGIGAFSG